MLKPVEPTPAQFETMFRELATSHGLQVLRVETTQDDLGAGLAVVDCYCSMSPKVFRASGQINWDLMQRLRQQIRVGYYENEEKPGEAMLEFDAFFMNFAGETV